MKDEQRKTEANIPGTVQRLAQTENVSAQPGSALHNSNMMPTVKVRPNSFFTSITVEVPSDKSKHSIVRLYDEEGKIIRMFGWFLVKGTNITTINELNALRSGNYFLDIMDNAGLLIFKTQLNKE